MRNLVIATVLALAAGSSFVGPGSAADLSTYYCDVEKPSYYGKYEPWSRREERPPRKGIWYYTSPQPPAVNFLVPMHGRYCARPTPWTPAWYQYCTERWPSFNPNTGMIRTPDGMRMCI